MPKIEQYERENGDVPFAEWFDSLSPQPAAKVTSAIIRMEMGNFGDSPSVGGGVRERKINFQRGYRIYFAMDGDDLVLLFWGGTKTRQQKDVNKAKELWNEYKERKRKLSKEEKKSGGKKDKPRRKKYMPLTRKFRQTVKNRADRDTAFRNALLAEALEAIVGGELDVAKALLRDYINATEGFETVGRAVEIPRKSLMRMLSQRGNPNAKNLFGITRYLQDAAGLKFKVVAVQQGEKSKKKKVATA